MDLAPSKKLFRDFSPASSGETLTPAATEARRRTYIFISIVALALFLRLYAISLYPLAGDEYNSIAGAKDIQLNWNSIIYAVLTHYWIRFGTSELWLRLPAAIFGSLSVVILFKIGEKVGGWRTGVVAGLLAAASPFNIYHSQEMRFYSLFICASAAFILATIHYVEGKKTKLSRATVLTAALFLTFSHFLGILALCAQSLAAVLASKSKWPKRRQLSVVFGLLVLIGLPLIPVVQRRLWQFYSAHAGVMEFSPPVINKVSIVNFAKAAFAGYTFIFGYHVYPLKLVVVTVGLSVCGLLVSVGTVRLWKESRWKMLPQIYLLTIFAVYFVLNSIGGRMSSVIGPRHGAFVWPVFILLLAIGVTSFHRSASYALLAILLTINAFSIWSGWQKEWTYGPTEDYRSAAAYASRWTTKDAVLLIAGRSAAPVDFYFPKTLRLVNSYLEPQSGDLVPPLSNHHVIFVTDDWEPDRRRGFDRLLRRVSEDYDLVDGRVDYPLFEYVFLRKPSPPGSGYSLNAGTGQLRQPLSFYGVEFQDLRLPIAVKVNDVPLKVVGAYGLPSSEGDSEVIIPLSQPAQAGKLILLTHLVGLNEMPTGQSVAEVVVESKTRGTSTFPMRLNRETASWNKQCQPTAECKTVFQWHKRLAIVGQNSFPDAWRDFPVGLHGALFDLPQGTEVTTLTFRYLAGSGHFYIWAIALAA